VPPRPGPRRARRPGRAGNGCGAEESAHPVPAPPVTR
jgi:hypothetical protein